MLVIGGGPAGIAAAVEAARYGDRVTLLERGDDIGGQLRLAGRAPAHTETWEAVCRRRPRDLARPASTCGSAPSPTTADADGHDLVVVATGARPFARRSRPRLPFRVLQAWEAIADPGAVVGRRSWPTGAAATRASTRPSSWPPPACDVELASGRRGAGRGRAPVPAQPLPRAPRPGRRAHPPPPGARARRRLRHVFSGREEEIGESRRSSWPRAARPTTSCGAPSRAVRASSGRATCWVRDRPRRRSSKARSRCGRLIEWGSSGEGAR